MSFRSAVFAAAVVVAIAVAAQGQTLPPNAAIPLPPLTLANISDANVPLYQTTKGSVVHLQWITTNNNSQINSAADPDMIKAFKTSLPRNIRFPFMDSGVQFKKLKCTPFTNGVGLNYTTPALPSNATVSAVGGKKLQFDTATKTYFINRKLGGKRCFRIIIWWTGIPVGQILLQTK